MTKWVLNKMVSPQSKKWGLSLRLCVLHAQLSIRLGLQLAGPCIDQVLSLVLEGPRAGSGVVRIVLLHFLAGCHKRQLNQAMLSLS